MSTAQRYTPRTSQTWRKPALLIVAVFLLVAGGALFAYAQVQTTARVFTSAPTARDASPGPQVRQAAGGIWPLTVSFDTRRLASAIEGALPQALYTAQEVQSLRPYWSLDRQDISLDVQAQLIGSPQVRLDTQGISVLHPATLSVTASAGSLKETEVREFALQTRFALGLDSNWQVLAQPIGTGQVLGLSSPTLFASITPDLSALERELAEQILGAFDHRLNDWLASNIDLPAALAALNVHLGDLPHPFDPLGLNAATLQEVRYEATGAVFEILLSAAAPGDGAGVPDLQTANPTALDTASALYLPFDLSLSVAELSTMLAANERELRIGEGSLQVNKTRILRPFGDAFLVKIDAWDIDPGGHQFDKRGTFHILARVGIDAQGRGFGFTSARMPADPQQLSFALNGRSWLQSDALAQGLLQDLPLADISAPMAENLDRIEQAFVGPIILDSLQGQWLSNQLDVSPGQSIYGDDTGALTLGVHPNTHLLVSL